jgi:L-rhamnose mutarotase
LSCRSTPVAKRNTKPAIARSGPELERTLRAHGVLNYSIFLHPETRQLFAYAEIESEEKWAAIAQPPVCRRWWAHLKDVMPANLDESPVSVELREVFHLENSPATTRSS